MGSPIFSAPEATNYFTGSPSPVRDVSYSITGTKGSTRYFYWVVATYSWGSVAPRAPLIVANGPDVLGVTGSVVLSWIQPSSQIVSYSVLRTTTNLFPGSSTTAVATALTATTVTDSGAALTAFTFTAIPTMRGVIYIDGTGPVPVLISNIGMQVSGSLSASSLTASQSTGASTLASWKNYIVTLVGTNWQVTQPDGSIITTPTAAALTQDVPLVNLPPNSFPTFFRLSLLSGPCTGVTTAYVGGLGYAATSGTAFGIIGAGNFSLIVSPSNSTFVDNAGSISTPAVNVPQIFTVRVVTTGGNVSSIIPPCSFIVSLFWGTTF